MSDIVVSGGLSINPAVTEAFETIRKRTVKARSTKTSKDKVKIREGKAGRKFKYIDRTSAMEWLDKHYPGWSFIILPDSYREDPVWLYMAGELTVYEPEGLKRAIRCYGCIDLKKRKDTGALSYDMPYIKAIETDALKRCVFSLGGFADVYSETEVENVEDSDTWFFDTAIPLLVTLSYTGIEELNSTKIGMIVKSYMSGKINRKVIEERFKLYFNNKEE